MLKSNSYDFTAKGGSVADKNKSIECVGIDNLCVLY